MGDWEILLLIWCGLAIATGIVTLVADGMRKKRLHLDHVDHVAASKRVVSMNAYKARMGAK